MHRNTVNCQRITIGSLYFFRTRVSPYGSEYRLRKRDQNKKTYFLIIEWGINITLIKIIIINTSEASSTAYDPADVRATLHMSHLFFLNPALRSRPGNSTVPSRSDGW